MRKFLRNRQVAGELGLEDDVDGIIVLATAARREAEPDAVPAPGTDALALLERLYPGREAVPVSGTTLALGGGGVHCITQQVPAR